ncbi:MAG: ferredoxin [Candidatus Micrarchaeota archaeon]
MAKIVHEVEKCIGCGACAAVCPSNWEMAGDKSKPKSTEITEIGCNKEAEESCPVNCIHIEE